MTVEELIQRLKQFPPSARVILVEELGADELKDSSISYELMHHIEYAPYWKHHSPHYGWEYPSKYDRKVIGKEMVVTIG